MKAKSFLVVSSLTAFFTLSLLLIGCGGIQGIPYDYNDAPSVPQILNPANGSSGLNPNVLLQWVQSIDPDNNAIIYRVYYAQSIENLNTEKISVTDTSVLISNLSQGTWYWKVVADDRKQDGKTPSPVYSFSVTAPIFVTGVSLNKSQTQILTGNRERLFAAVIPQMQQTKP